MLTIREPISLRTQRPIQSIRTDMAERMQANYGLMRLPIRKEELLHITSEPPEVYFAEGDTLQLFTNIKNENQQEIRLDVINNLMNRILVAQTENFTYQDTVYISSVLRKLGIRDEKTFMQQVFRQQNLHREIDWLVKQYETHGDVLQMLVQQEKEQPETEEKQAEPPTAQKQLYYLHEAIFKRLDTGRIYQDMRSFSKGLLHESRQIFRNEFSMGEQVTMAQEFHLHELKQQVMQEAVPLLHLHQNQYEFPQENLEEFNETLEERISAAILLNLTEQSYSLRRQQIEKNAHHWYSIAGALFQTAENTWKRYEANLVENRRVSNQMLQMLMQAGEVVRQEGDTIQNIAEEFHALNQEWKQSTTLRQQLVQQNRIQNETKEEISIGGGSYHLTQEELELQYLQQEAEEEEPRNEAAITAEEIKKQLEIFNQRNYETYQKLTKIEQLQPQARERRPDRKKAQQDALRALEHPDEVLTEFFKAEVQDPVLEREKELETKIYELFSDETKEIYRQFLQQKPYGQTTFLQHIMKQPAESELRQEVVYALEQLEKQELTEHRQQQFLQQKEIFQPQISQTIGEEIRQQVLSLQELQNAEIYYQISQPTEIHLQQQVNAETHLMKQMGEEREHLTVQHEEILQRAEAERSGKTADLPEKQSLIHPAKEEVEEVFRTETEKTILQQQEQRLTELHQTMEHQIRTQQEETVAETREQHREQRLQEAELFHETMDHITTEELQEKTVLQQQEEQLTEIRSSMERQMRKQQTEHLEELAATQREVQFRQVDIVHKAQEQLITEELLETIRAQQQNVKREEHLEETTLQRDQINQTVVQNTINHRQLNRLENMDELIQQTVKKQMNHLSDQIYGKIEKKLITERKRRGY